VAVKHRPRVAIFGATSAIARAAARLYAARGARLYLVGRDPEKLRAAVAELAGGDAAAAAAPAAGEVVAGCYAVDLADPAGAGGAAAVRAAIEALGQIDVALVAQGLLGDQQATERDFAEAELVIRTNFLSVVALLVPLANHMEAAAGGGRIAVMSSVAGDRGRPRNYTYGAAKGALNVYLQGLRTRLYARGIAVCSVKLGPVDTPMTASHRKTAVFASAAGAAAGVVAAIDARRAEAYVPWFWRPIMAVVRNLPEPLLQRLPFLAGR